MKTENKHFLILIYLQLNFLYNKKANKILSSNGDIFVCKKKHVVLHETSV